jgi:hypothetical protein
MREKINEMGEKAFHGRYYAGSFATLLNAILSLSFMGNCMAFDFASQKLLTDLRPIPILKWEGCGDLSNHTLECKIEIFTERTWLTRYRYSSRCSHGSFQRVIFQNIFRPFNQIISYKRLSQRQQNNPLQPRRSRRYHPLSSPTHPS